MATILVDLDRGSLLEVIDSHKSNEIIQALSQQPESMRDSVREVCVDMWGGFPKVIQEVFKNASIVIDCAGDGLSIQGRITTNISERLDRQSWIQKIETMAIECQINF